LDTYKNILTVLKLEHYHKLIAFMSFENRKRVALDITKNAIDFTATLSTAQQVNKLLEFIQPLIKDEEDQPQQVDDEDIDEEQSYVASLVHLFHSEDTEELFAMYVTARKHFGVGGPKRIKHTLIPLVFRVLKLAVTLKLQENKDSEWASKAKKVFKFAHETVTALARTSLPELSLRLFLQCAQATNKCGNAFETIAYEFLTQAFLIYEEQIADSQAQFNALQLIIGTLQLLDSFGEENYDTLITKTAMYSSKLLKKPDQCRAIYMCSHLFWSPQREYKKGKTCFGMPSKIAQNC